MPNLYGVANAPGLPVSVQPNLGSSGLSCSPNAYTTIITSPVLIAPSQGYFYCRVEGIATVQAAASLPTGFNFGVAIGAGTMTAGVSWGGQGVTASAFLWLSFIAFTAVSQLAWQGAGSVVNVGFQPSGNSMTVQQFPMAFFTLLRAPDQ